MAWTVMDWSVSKEVYRIAVWETATKGATTLRSEHTSLVSSLAFSPDGSLLASVALDGVAKLWKLGRVKRARRTK